MLPVLGAVPDGAIVLFSGMGPDAAKQLSVGVGALAGSTIMLLTIPWFLATFAGRVDLEGTKGGYDQPLKKRLSPENKFNFFKAGTRPSGEVKKGAYIMLITLVP